MGNHNFVPRFAELFGDAKYLLYLLIALYLIVLITNVLILARIKLQSKNFFWNTLYKEHCIYNNFLHELPLAITPILRWCC